MHFNIYYMSVYCNSPLSITAFTVTMATIRYIIYLT